VRNTLRFLLGALDGFTKAEMVEEMFDDPTILPELEQLVLHQLTEMDKKVQDAITNHQYGKIAKDLHEFCNENLSAFYFDIRKDRLYCDDPESFERKACRSVMAVLFNGLTAWLAPILSFTAEEAWQHRPAGVFGDEESVHLRTFPDVPAVWNNSGLAGKWFAVREVRDAILAELEPHRASKEIGSSLEAAPVVTVGPNYKKAIDELPLADIAIVSDVRIEAQDKEGVTVSFAKAEGQKCARCWKVKPEVDPDGDTLCNRCADIVLKKKAA
jgi:isoleucyl-tRNA synthetase